MGMSTEAYLGGKRIDSETSKFMQVHSDRTDIAVNTLAANAQVTVSNNQLTGQKYEADRNKEVQFKIADVELKKAELDFRARITEAKNDAVRAEASVIAANAKQTEAEAKVLREQNRGSRDRLRFESGGSGFGGFGFHDYFYG